MQTLGTRYTAYMNDQLKHASWLELFYDLAFVAIVAQYTYALSAHHATLFDLITALFAGYMIFIAWWGTTVSRNLQDTESTKDRLLVHFQVLMAFLMSLTLSRVFGGAHQWFFASFAVIRLVQALMLVRFYALHPEQKPRTFNVLQSVVIGAVVWLVAASTPLPYAYVLAAMALSLDILGPLTEGKGNKVRLLNVAHLQERLGLFLLLTMGESVLVVALANTVTKITLLQTIFVLTGVLTMIGLWWLYFPYLEHCGEGRRPKKLFYYLHAHAFLYGSVVLVAAAYKNILKAQTFVLTDLLLLAAGFFGLAVTLLVVRAQLTGIGRRTILAAFGFLVLLVLLVLVALASWILSSLLLAVCGLAAVVIVAALLDEWRRTYLVR